ncbi:hypothetical protein [Burkholderia cenocepacia]|uniref:hypothetical protein n=1 Tax=Burkholderia cenocepacia TaxID=95486 RepID=UPI0019CFF6B1|nr:hypothetical protein [Burkholderia cenocepacia]
MTAGPDGLFLKSDDGKVNLLVTTVPLLNAWAKRVDMGLKSKDDVAVIFASEPFYTDVSADDATVYRLAELPVKRKPADAVKKALLLGESQDGGWRGPNTLTVSVKQGGGFRVLELHARSFSVVCMVLVKIVLVLTISGIFVYAYRENKKTNY